VKSTKPRNTKGKAIAPLKAMSAKKSNPGKNPPSRASAKKKDRPAGKPSEKSSEKEKKPTVLKKTVKKKLPASPAPAAKKTAASKPPAKSAGVDAKAVKKKVATTPKTVKKTAAKKPAKISSKKASPVLKRSSQATKERKPIKAGKEKIPEKTKVRKTAGTKKSGARVLKPVPPKQQKKVGSRAKGPEKKSTSRGKGKKAFEHIVRAELPEEYGENELIVMAVDPNVVFVDWEIKKEEATEALDGFTMRVFDVTEGESLGLHSDSFFDIKIEGRVGSGFFEFDMPGREVAVEIGLYDNGKFLPILRSPAVSMPGLLVSDELGITNKMVESGIPVGY
jgi:hypothetical protein